MGNIVCDSVIFLCKQSLWDDTVVCDFSISAAKTVQWRKRKGGMDKMAFLHLLSCTSCYYRYFKNSFVWQCSAAVLMDLR